MALKLPIRFPIFAPILNPSNPNQSPLRPPTEIRFSRWNNANADSFNQRRRAQQEIEDDIRRHRRFSSATKIADVSETSSTASDTFKSIGTPSSPSRPSIPGKKSKYSKNPKPNSGSDSHPAFRRFMNITKVSDVPDEKPHGAGAKVTVSEDGVSYLIEGAPFEIKHSYTETPKVKPLKLREPPFSPFGPTTIQRPWTGRAPLPPSKKKLKEFDSFVLPPPGKKGVKPVQSPGPFLQGSGPKYVMSREEILGEPLTAEEIKDLINGCIKTKRQLNIGRDGLTHNMLDNIHAHWKRRRVCKIKCKGVCTVDMDNVRQQLEEKTGGKIIYSTGGLLYLFRGRNYNYKTRPRFPLMLWKPVTPVYPRLIQRAPEDLTLEEANEMRKKGRQLIPICKLGKNGVYAQLVKHVREAFEEFELVRINCQGMNGSDYRKIGAKLKDLVPCVLISFEHEHILMWRGRNWKFSFPKLDVAQEEAKESTADDSTFVASSPENQTPSVSYVSSFSGKDSSLEELTTSILPMGMGDSSNGGSNNYPSIEIDQPQSATDSVSMERTTYNNASISGNFSADDESKTMSNSYEVETISPDDSIFGDGSEATSTILCETQADNQEQAAKLVESDTILGNVGSLLQSFLSADMNHEELNGPAWSSTPSMDRVLKLCKQAVEGGSAVFLGDDILDADIVYKKAVSLSHSAPLGPVFHRPSNVIVKKFKPLETQEGGVVVKPFKPREAKVAENSQTTEVITVVRKKESETKSSKVRRKDGDQMYSNDVPQGSLRIDELAKLLA